MKRIAHSAHYIEYGDGDDDEEEEDVSATSMMRTSPALSYSVQSAPAHLQQMAALREMSHSAPSLWTDSVDAVAFNTLLAMQDIETYNVRFLTRVCGIELVPFDEHSNLGAVVVKCHTDFSRERVCDQSLVVAIAGECVVSMDYDEILARIANSTRPLKLTFHPPIVDKVQLIEDASGGGGSGEKMRRMMMEYASRPSFEMRFNGDSDEDAPSSYDQRRGALVPPHQLFQNSSIDMEVVHKHYKMLYHQYFELAQLHQLTKDTIHDKLNEVRRLTRENSQLQNLLSERDSRLQQIQMDQSSEQQRGQQMWHKYQTLQEQNVALGHQTAQQQQDIEQLRSDLRQSQLQTRDATRAHNELNKKLQKYEETANQHSKKTFKKKKTKKTGLQQQHQMMNAPKLTTSMLSSRSASSANDLLQNELRQKLRARNSENGVEKPSLRRSGAGKKPTATTTTQDKKASQQHHDRDNHKVSNKKRQSGIGTLFKTLTSGIVNSKRSDEQVSSVSSPKESKYHPQLQHMVEDGIKRKLSQLPSPIANAAGGRRYKTRQSKSGNNPTRARSSSLESNTGRTRKETIV